MATKDKLAKRAWKTLSEVNVNEMTELKGNLTYLSWAHAFDTLMKYYPESDYDTSFENLEDGSVMTYATLTISEGDESFSRNMWLPVMDYKNKAVKNPDARQISDTMMRCVTKCIAMCGLGLYVYQGEDLPSAEKDALSEVIDDKQVQALKVMIGQAQMKAAQICTAYGVQQLTEIPKIKFDEIEARLNVRIEKLAEKAAEETEAEA